MSERIKEQRGWSAAWLAIGANVGDPARQLAEAVLWLGTTSGIAVLAESKVIVTEPWGKTDQDRFHNMAISVETILGPLDLLAACLAVELSMGRVRMERWGPRLVDIDVIAYERIEMTTDTLTLPHPFAHERDFVLVPLREIAPDVADWIVSRARPNPPPATK